MICWSSLTTVCNCKARCSTPWWLITSFNPELRHNMDYLAEIYLNYQTIHIEELIGPKGKNQGNMRDLPPASVYEYACEDADVTLKLKNKLERNWTKTMYGNFLKK